VAGNALVGRGEGVTLVGEGEEVSPSFCDRGEGESGVEPATVEIAGGAGPAGGGKEGDEVFGGVVEGAGV
jgi:hypothetical protein